MRTLCTILIVAISIYTSVLEYVLDRGGWYFPLFGAALVIILSVTLNKMGDD